MHPDEFDMDGGATKARTAQVNPIRPKIDITRKLGKRATVQQSRKSTAVGKRATVQQSRKTVAAIKQSRRTPAVGKRKKSSSLVEEITQIGKKVRKEANEKVLDKEAAKVNKEVEASKTKQVADKLITKQKKGIRNLTGLTEGKKKALIKTYLEGVPSEVMKMLKRTYKEYLTITDLIKQLKDAPDESAVKTQIDAWNKLMAPKIQQALKEYAKLQKKKEIDEEIRQKKLSDQRAKDYLDSEEGVKETLLRVGLPLQIDGKLVIAKMIDNELYAPEGYYVGIENNGTEKGEFKFLMARPQVFPPELGIPPIEGRTLNPTTGANADMSPENTKNLFYNRLYVLDTRNYVVDVKDGLKILKIPTDSLPYYIKLVQLTKQKVPEVHQFIKNIYAYMPWSADTGEPLWENREKIYDTAIGLQRKIENLLMEISTLNEEKANSALPEGSPVSNTDLGGGAMIGGRTFAVIAENIARANEELDEITSQLAQKLTQIVHPEDVVAHEQSVLELIKRPDKMQKAYFSNATRVSQSKAVAETVFKIAPDAGEDPVYNAGVPQILNNLLQRHAETAVELAKVMHLCHVYLIYHFFIMIRDFLHDVASAEGIETLKITFANYMNANRDWLTGDLKTLYENKCNELESNLGVTPDQDKLRDWTAMDIDELHRKLYESGYKDFQNNDGTSIFPSYEDTAHLTASIDDKDALRTMARVICKEFLMTDGYTESTNGQQKALFKALYDMCRMLAIVLGLASSLDAGSGWSMEEHKAYVTRAQTGGHSQNVVMAERPLLCVDVQGSNACAGITDSVIIPHFDMNFDGTPTQLTFKSGLSGANFVAYNFTSDIGHYKRWVGNDNGRTCVITTYLKVPAAGDEVGTTDMEDTGEQRKHVEIFRVYQKTDGTYDTGALNRLTGLAGLQKTRGAEDAVSNSKLTFCKPGTSKGYDDKELQDLCKRDPLVKDAILKWKTLTDAFQLYTIQMANTSETLRGKRRILVGLFDKIASMQLGFLGGYPYIVCTNGIITLHVPTTIRESPVTVESVLPRIQIALFLVKHKEGFLKHCEDSQRIIDEWINFMQDDSNNPALAVAALIANESLSKSKYSLTINNENSRESPVANEIAQKGGVDNLARLRDQIDRWEKMFKTPEPTTLTEVLKIPLSIATIIDNYLKLMTVILTFQNAYKVLQLEFDKLAQITIVPKKRGQETVAPMTLEYIAVIKSAIVKYKELTDERNPKIIALFIASGLLSSANPKFIKQSANVKEIVRIILEYLSNPAVIAEDLIGTDLIKNVLDKIANVIDTIQNKQQSKESIDNNPPSEYIPYMRYYELFEQRSIEVALGKRRGRLAVEPALSVIPENANNENANTEPGAKRKRKNTTSPVTAPQVLPQQAPAQALPQQAPPLFAAPSVKLGASSAQPFGTSAVQVASWLQPPTAAKTALTTTTKPSFATAGTSFGTTGTSVGTAGTSVGTTGTSFGTNPGGINLTSGVVNTGGFGRSSGRTSRFSSVRTGVPFLSTVQSGVASNKGGSAFPIRQSIVASSSAVQSTATETTMQNSSGGWQTRKRKQRKQKKTRKEKR